MVPVDLLEKVGKVVKETEGMDRSKLFCVAVDKYLDLNSADALHNF